jgi:hypothetical protein
MKLKEWATAATTSPELTVVQRHPAHIVTMLQYCDQSEDTAATVASLLTESGRLHSGTDGSCLNDEGTFGRTQ